MKVVRPSGKDILPNFVTFRQVEMRTFLGGSSSSVLGASTCVRSCGTCKVKVRIGCGCLRPEQLSLPASLCVAGLFLR